jgi:uncharacterized FlaG/YvyC family protein
MDTTNIASVAQVPPIPIPQASADPVPSPTPPQAIQSAVASSTSPATKEQLQAQLDAALKNSGIKTEIENERSGLVIVRFVQADTGQLILQMPPQGVLDLVADLEKQMEANQPPLAGQIVDTKV